MLPVTCSLRLVPLYQMLSSVQRRALLRYLNIVRKSETGFEILTRLLLKKQVSWASSARRFVGSRCMHLQVQVVFFSISTVLGTAEDLIILDVHSYIYIYRFPNVFLRCPTPRLHCFLSSHWPSFRFMAFSIPSIQFFFGLRCAPFCFGILFNTILGNLPSGILWTWPYYVSWLCSISFIIVSSNPICCLIVTFLILSFLDILEDLLRTSISVASSRHSSNHTKKSKQCDCRHLNIYK